jgi:hypothetical protein
MNLKVVMRAEWLLASKFGKGAAQSLYRQRPGRWLPIMKFFFAEAYPQIIPTAYTCPDLTLITEPKSFPI